jgi:hypothetical protein
MSRTIKLSATSLFAVLLATIVVPEKVSWSNKGEGFQQTLATVFLGSKHNHSTSR